MTGARSIRKKSGQAIIFLLAVMVIGLLVVMWNFDLHRVISAKVRVGNAGDAAAQSAARWQGITMNMVGELNLIQAAMLLQEPDAHESVAELSTLRDRIALTGPLMGFFEAQSVASINLKAEDGALADNGGASYRNELRERAEEYMAAGNSYYGVLAPYPEAWFEYGSLLYEISQVGLVVECANPKWYSFYNGSHILLEPGFYNAVLSSDWCWFQRNGHEDLLISSGDETFWSDLPELEQRSSVNSEYFGTGLRRVYTSLRVEENHLGGYGSAGLEDERAAELEEYLVNDAEEIKGVSPVLSQFFSEDLMIRTFPWHFYDPSDWSDDFFEWSRSDPGDFPFREGTQIRPEFNYSGADAAIDVAIPAQSRTPGIQMMTDRILWRAAAKPFGYLELEEGDVQGRVVPNYFDLVLPAFHQVRLIPNGVSSRPHEVISEGWEEHIYQHLPEYMNNGTSALRGRGCYYCQALLIWDDPGFRERGARWLEQYGDSCETRGSGGSVDTGGTSDWR